jgi:photosystem II stability/assembly factor-like uncharacterized protein
MGRLLYVLAFVGMVHGTGHAGNPVDGRLYAAAFLVRGSVSGHSTGEFGVFVHTAGTDTGWTRVTRSNLFTFGLGFYERNTTRRYYIAAGNGLHRSYDGLTGWKILTSWKTMEILSVVPDPVDSLLIYVSTPWGVYRTVNGGTTWDEAMRGMHRWFVKSLAMDVRDRRTLYATAEDDLYRTTDGGDHWAELNVGAALAFQQSRDNPQRLLVGTRDNGIYRSDDGGASWTHSAGTGGAAIYTIGMSGGGLYAAGWKTGLLESRDDGNTWRVLWDAPGIDGMFCIFTFPGDPLHLLVGTDGQGVYESPDGGTTWRCAGLSGGKIKQIALYP